MIHVTRDSNEFRNSAVRLDNGKILAVQDFELVDHPEIEDKCLKMTIDNSCFGVQYIHNLDVPRDCTDAEFQEHWKLKPFQSRYNGYGCLTQRLTPYYAENGLFDEDGNWIPCTDFTIRQVNKEWILEVVLAPESFEYTVV
jgi:hypothetical protein